MNTKLWKRSCGVSRWLNFKDQPKIPTNAPISKLPNELIGEIFLSTLPTDWIPVDEPDALPPLSLVPLTLSHVCSHWRAIALSLPMLYSTIWIDRPRAVHVHIIALLLERSHSFPLSIYLRQTDPKTCLAYPTPDEHQYTNDVLALLVQHLPRWESVEMSFKSRAQEALAVLPSSSEGSILEHISLDLDAWDACSADAFQSALFMRANASLRSVLFPPNAQLPGTLSWGALTIFSAAPECTIDTVLGILAAAPALEHAHFVLSGQPDWAPPFVPPEEIPVRCPNLRTLELTGRRIPLAGFFSRIVLPALEELVLEYAYVVREEGGDSEIAALRSWLERSACPLATFTLREFTRTPCTTLASSFLPLLPASLTALSLETRLSDALLELFSPAEEMAFPALASLTLTDTHYHQDEQHLTPGLLALVLLGRPQLRLAALNVRLKGHVPAEDVFPEAMGGPEVQITRFSCPCDV